VLAELPAGFVGGFTTRGGGISSQPWAALNLGLGVGDDPALVGANRRLVANWLGVPRLVLPRQQHGADVHLARVGDSNDVGEPAVDALVSGAAGLAVGVLVADCVPVLLADPRTGMFGAVHAGRRGLAAGVIQAAMQTMATAGARPADMVAVVGPAVCGGCYEVPQEMQAEVAAVVPGTASTTRSGTPALDLPAGAAEILRGLGVGAVAASRLCTIEDPRFYSYRRDGRTGRFAAVIAQQAVR